MQHFVQHDTTFLQKYSKYTNLTAGKLLLLPTHEYNRVQQSCMGWPNEYNIIQHCGKQKKCFMVKHLFSESLTANKLHTTVYNMIQHDTTRWPNECSISDNIKVVRCCMKCCTRLAGALNFTSTCGEQHFSLIKSKVSENK